jgi:hypothetical protein
MNETLTGRITREITFGITDRRTTRVTAIVRKPAGTEVYVTRTHKDGTWDIRVAGTLLTQNVYPASVESF